MSAFCDIALVIGLTFGGTCAEPGPEPAPLTLPADDESVWALPDPPEPPPAQPPAPAPQFPAVVITREVVVPAPTPEPAPAPVTAADVAPAPEIDPYRAALEAAWSNASVQQSTGYGTPGLAVQSASSAAIEDNAISDMGRMVAPDPLNLRDLAKEKADYEGDRRTSTLPVDNSRIVTADRYISVQLETGINSQVGGEETGTVIVQTTRPVFGYHGRHVLIPTGSRLICNYLPPEDMGSSRLAIDCERILLGGHRAEIRNLGSHITNQQGWLGATGEVDRRFLERYGNAFLLTGVSTGVRYAAATTTTEDADGEAATAAAEKAAEELSNKFGEITASILEETLSLKPIITIPQGTRLQIRPATDWYIAEME